MENVYLGDNTIVSMQRFHADNFSSLKELSAAVASFVEENNVIVHNIHFSSDDHGENMTLFYEASKAGLINNQQEKVFKALIEWLRIKAKYEINHGAQIQPHQISTLEADIWHSALLKRLLRGIPAIADPPPKSFSYPWYELIENQRGEPMTVTVLEDKQGVIIDQFLWKLRKTFGEDDYVVTYQEEYPLEWRLRKINNKWELSRLVYGEGTNRSSGGEHRLHKEDSGRVEYSDEVRRTEIS